MSPCKKEYMTSFIYVTYLPSLGIQIFRAWSICATDATILQFHVETSQHMPSF